MRTYSDFLYARPSFIEGAARVFDLGGTLNEYNYTQTGHEADAIALWMDWAAIAQDIHDAIGEFEAQEAEALTQDAA